MSASTQGATVQRKRGILVRLFAGTGDLIWNKIGLRRLLPRFFFALLVVFGTWNPTGYSFVGIVWGNSAQPIVDWFALHMYAVFFAVVLLGCWIFLTTMTKRSLGHMGLLIGVVLLVIAVGIIAMNFNIAWSGQLLLTVILFGISILFAFGMLGANVIRGVTGMMTVTQSGTVDTHNTDTPLDHHHVP